MSTTILLKAIRSGIVQYHNCLYNQYKNLIILLLLVIPIVPTAAQDSTSNYREYTLDEVIVVSANKLDTKLQDVSTKVEMIDQEEIEASNGTGIPGILKQTNTGFIKSYGHNQSLQTISINGLGPEHTLVLIDGVRMNSFQNSQIDLSLIPKESIKRIEIINNGVSSIYGSNAIGGVVNIISKNRESYDAKQLNLNASVQRGSFNTHRYSVGLYKESRNFNVRGYYSSENSDGDFKYFYDNGKKKTIKERENASYSVYDAGINAQYIIDENNLIRLITSYSDQDKNVPGIETGTPSPETNQLDKNWNNIIIAENNLSKEITLRSNLNFQNDRMDYSVEPYLDSYYKNLVYSASSEVKFKKNKYKITTGYDYSHAVLESNEVENGISRDQHAIFLSSSYDIFKGLKIYPSARYDYISDIEEDAVTYKFGFNYQPFEDIDFGIRGNAGRNFRAPTFNSLYWKNGGNKDLNPEKSVNAEAGMFYSFSTIVNGKVDITYTYINAEDKIVWAPQSTGLWTPRNVAESVSNNFAINASIKKKLTHKLLLNLDAGIKFVNAKKTTASYRNDPSKGKYAPYVPRQSANMNLRMKFGITEVNLFYNFMGERYSDFANEKRMEDYSIVDGNISFDLKMLGVTSKLRLEANNIFNADYQVISGYPMPLRNYSLTLSFKY